MALIANIHKRLNHFDLDTRLVCEVGQLTAIVGPSGSGKTTLMRCIAGLEEPDRGTIALHGRFWWDSSTGRFVPTYQRKIGLVFQEYPLFPHMTVRRNIEYGAEAPGVADELMETFSIGHLADRRPSAISGGERQRAAFCQALAREPDLLLLDEPFSALDQETRRFLCSVLADLKGRLNIPILHVTHDLREATTLADNVVAVEQGRIAPEWLSRQVPPSAPYAAPVQPTI
jgi:molybdate transport system ATP-binding protein